MIETLDATIGAGAELHARQLERAPIAIERARTKVQRLEHDGSAAKLMRAAQATRTTAKRVVWMHHAASAWSKQFEAVAACQKGCSHCCRMPITITRREAKQLAQASGRRVAAEVATIRPYELPGVDAIQQAEAELRHWAEGTPCPFLEDDRCAVYDTRPTVCRVLINLDDDDLLCRHSGAGDVQVPYADSRRIRALALAAEPDLELADIRDFFA